MSDDIETVCAECGADLLVDPDLHGTRARPTGSAADLSRRLDIALEALREIANGTVRNPHAHAEVAIEAADARGAAPPAGGAPTRQSVHDALCAVGAYHLAGAVLTCVDDGWDALVLALRASPPGGPAAGEPTGETPAPSEPTLRQKVTRAALILAQDGDLHAFDKALDAALGAAPAPGGPPAEPCADCRGAGGFGPGGFSVTDGEWQGEPCAACAATGKETVRLRRQKDGAYRERDMCVALMARLAASLGYRVGMGRHEGEWEDDWRWVVYVDLPTGQVSWHIHDSERDWFDFPAYPGAWDGHTTEQKYERVLASAAAPDVRPPNIPGGPA